LDPDSLERRTELQVFLTAKVLADPEDDDFALKAQNLSAMGMPKSADDLKRAVMQRPRLNDDDPARRGNLAL